MWVDWADLLVGAGAWWRERGRDCSFTLLSPFNFPIHFPHIVRRREFCSGLIHHLMRATKSLLKSFSNNTFWRLRMRNNFFPPLSISPFRFFFFFAFPAAHLSSISFPTLSLTVICGEFSIFFSKKRGVGRGTIIPFWFDMILTSNAFLLRHVLFHRMLTDGERKEKDVFKTARVLGAKIKHDCRCECRCERTSYLRGATGFSR